MSYPSAIDSFTTLVDNLDYVMAAHPNDRGAAITNIETTLGTYLKNCLYKGYCGPLSFSPDSGDTSHDIVNTAFDCRDDSDADDLNVSALVKQMDATFAAGTAAGGMQSGSSLSTNTGYLVYAIGDSTRVKSPDIMAVPIGTTFAYPSGYDLKRCISFFRTDGSSNIIAFHQYNRFYYYDAWQSLATGTVAAWTSLAMASYVPVALSTIAIMQLSSTTNQGAQLTNNSSVSSTDTLVNNVVAIAGNGKTDVVFMIPILTTSTLYWGSSAGTVYCAGFFLNLI